MAKPNPLMDRNHRRRVIAKAPPALREPRALGEPLTLSNANAKLAREPSACRGRASKQDDALLSSNDGVDMNKGSLRWTTTLVMSATLSVTRRTLKEST